MNYKIITEKIEDNASKHLLVNEIDETIAHLEEVLGEEYLEDVTPTHEGSFFIECSFTNYNDTDCKALLNSKGKIIKKGFLELIEVIPNKNYFIITTNSEVDEDYSVDDDYEAWGVIDSTGDYVVEPKFYKIAYLADFNLFLCDGKILYNPNEIEEIGYYDEKIETENLISFSVNSKMGLYSKRGILLEALYEDIRLTESNDIVILKKEMKVSIYHWKTKSRIEVPFDSIKPKMHSLNGMICFVALKEKKYGIINELGNTIVNFNFLAINEKSIINVVELVNGKEVFPTYFIAREYLSDNYCVYRYSDKSENKETQFNREQFGIKQISFLDFKVIELNSIKFFIGMHEKGIIQEIWCFKKVEKYYSKQLLTYKNHTLKGNYQICIFKLEDKFGIIDNSENHNYLLPFEFDSIEPITVEPIGVAGFLTYRQDSKLYQIWDANFKNYEYSNEREERIAPSQKSIISDERREIAIDAFKTLVINNFNMLT
jgi:hypothetical protein